MTDSSSRGSTGAPDTALPIEWSAAHAATYLVRLYIVGQATSSMLAIAAVKDICERHLADCYELEVIDLYLQPRMAERDHIIVAPTLVRVRPAPVRRFTGDFSQTDRVLTTLMLKPRPLPRLRTAST